MQMSRCNPEEWVREAESCGQGLSQSVGCDTVWWMALDAHRAGSLGSSIWESQPQTIAAHTSCLKDERILFAAVSAFQGKCLFVLQIKQLLKEARERLQAERGLEKEVQCLAASNSVSNTSNRLKWCKIHSAGPAPSHATVWGEESLSCHHFFSALSVSKEARSPFHRIVAWLRRDTRTFESSSCLCAGQPQTPHFCWYMNIYVDCWEVSRF